MYKHKSKPNSKDRQRSGGSANKGITAQVAAWLSKREYPTVITQLSALPELSRDERYAYGYALVQSGKVALGLAAWGPLLGKYGPDFDQDCRQVAQEALNGAASQGSSWGDLPKTQLLPLFQAARAVAPGSTATLALRQHAVAALWEVGDPESLRTLVKLLDSAKEPSGPAKMMNLAKVRWRLSNPKSVGEAAPIQAAFLSAAATYALTRLSVCPLTMALPALADAFMQPLSAAGLHNHGSLATLSRLEVAAMLDVFFTAQEQGLALPEGQLFAPGYLRQEDRADVVAFKQLLEQLPEPVRYAYTADGYWVLLAAAGIRDAYLGDLIFGGQSDDGQNGVSSESPFGPRLTLRMGMALLERAAVPEDGELSMDVLRKIAPKADSLRPEINAELLRIAEVFLTPRSSDEQHRAELVSSAWLTITAATLPSTALSEDVKKVGDHLALAKIAKSLGGGGQWPDLLRHLLPMLHDAGLKTRCEAILARTEEAASFFELMIKDKTMKLYKKIATTQATPEDVLSFVALVADAGRLTFHWHQGWNAKTRDLYFGLVSDLVFNKTINTKIPLAEHLTDCTDCPCDFHCRALVQERLPAALAALGHPLLDVPSVKVNAPKPATQEWVRYASLTSGGPFQMLGVHRDASKAEILAATMARMRDQTQPLTELRMAQNALFSGPSRLVFEFLGCLEPGPQPVPEAEDAPPLRTFNPKTLRLRGIWSQGSDARH